MYTIQSGYKIKKKPHCLCPTLISNEIVLFIPLSAYFSVSSCSQLPLLTAHHLTQSYQTPPKHRILRFASSSLEKSSSLIAQLVWLPRFVSVYCLQMLIGLDLCLSVFGLPSFPYPPNWKNTLTLLISVMPLTHFVPSMTAYVVFMSLWLLWPFCSQKEQAIIAHTLKRTSTWDGAFVFKLSQVEHIH